MGKKSNLNSDNEPFAKYRHMVQKKPCWMADDPMKGYFTFGMMLSL